MKRVQKVLNFLLPALSLILLIPLASCCQKYSDFPVSGGGMGEIPQASGKAHQRRRNSRSCLGESSSCSQGARAVHCLGNPVWSHAWLE